LPKRPFTLRVFYPPASAKEKAAPVWDGLV